MSKIVKTRSAEIENLATKREAALRQAADLEARLAAERQSAEQARRAAVAAWAADKWSRHREITRPILDAWNNFTAAVRDGSEILETFRAYRIAVAKARAEWRVIADTHYARHARGMLNAPPGPGEGHKSLDQALAVVLQDLEQETAAEATAALHAEIDAAEAAAERREDHSYEPARPLAIFECATHPQLAVRVEDPHGHRFVRFEQGRLELHDGEAVEAVRQLVGRKPYGITEITDKQTTAA